MDLKYDILNEKTRQLIDTAVAKAGKDQSSLNNSSIDSLLPGTARTNTPANPTYMREYQSNYDLRPPLGEKPYIDGMRDSMSPSFKIDYSRGPSVVELKPYKIGN
ncbi:MAG: hypothetical protein ACMXYE_02310 [Candidatus Woesearchaeota archaeon]